MYRRNHYEKDPHWIDVRFPARCACGQTIYPGDRGFYFPIGKTVVCEACGVATDVISVERDINRILKAH